MNGNESNNAIECRRYADILERNPLDIVCMGIGENAHIAFNLPQVANFYDPQFVKEVIFDEVSRQQQIMIDFFQNLSWYRKWRSPLPCQVFERQKVFIALYPVITNHKQYIIQLIVLFHKIILLPY